MNAASFAMRFPARFAARIQMSSTGATGAVSNDDSAEAAERNPATTLSRTDRRLTAAMDTRNAATIRNRHRPYAWASGPNWTTATFNPNADATKNVAGNLQCGSGKRRYT